MQRKAIRAVVGGVDIDIPIHTFTPNQFVFYDGTAIFTQVAVTPVGTPTPGHLASWFTGSSIQDSGVVLGDVVTNPGTSLVNQLATFRDSTGKVLQAVTITANSGSLFSVVNINSRPVDSFITGPSSAVNGNLLSFSGTTGRDAVDSGVSVTNVVTTTSTPTANTVATFVGTGKAIQPVTVTISGGAIANVSTINTINPATWVVGPASATDSNIAIFIGSTGKLIGNSTVSILDVVVGPASAVSNNLASYNGVSGKFIKDSGVASSLVTAHGTRHMPGGADPVFAGVNKWGNGDIPMYRDDADGFPYSPSFFRAAICEALTLSATYDNPHGIHINSGDDIGSDLPWSNLRAGDYIAEWNFIVEILDSTVGNLNVKPVWTSGSGTAIVTVSTASQYVTIPGTPVSFAMATAPPQFAVRVTLGVTGAGAGSDCSVSFAKSSGTGVVKAFGTCFIMQTLYTV